jgi:hypothetical protein
VKAVTAAQLSMAADGVYSVSLDEAIEAMRLTATDMSVKYKETSLSVRVSFACYVFSRSLKFVDQGLAVSILGLSADFSPDPLADDR